VRHSRPEVRLGALRFRSLATPTALFGPEQSGVTRPLCASSCDQEFTARLWRGCRGGVIRPPWSIGFKRPVNRHPGRRHIGGCKRRVGVRGSVTRRRHNVASRSGSHRRALNCHSNNRCGADSVRAMRPFLPVGSPVCRGAGADHQWPPIAAPDRAPFGYCDQTDNRAFVSPYTDPIPDVKSSDGP